jgi:hypothetical protein
LPCFSLRDVPIAGDYRAANVTTSDASICQAPAATDGWGLITWWAMSFSEIVLLVMGTLIFAAAMTLAIGIALRVFTVS